MACERRGSVTHPDRVADLSLSLSLARYLPARGDDETLFSLHQSANSWSSIGKEFFGKVKRQNLIGALLSKVLVSLLDNAFSTFTKNRWL